MGYNTFGVGGGGGVEGLVAVVASFCSAEWWRFLFCLYVYGCFGRGGEKVVVLCAGLFAYLCEGVSVLREIGGGDWPPPRL